MARNLGLGRLSHSAVYAHCGFFKDQKHSRMIAPQKQPARKPRRGKSGMLLREEGPPLTPLVASLATRTASPALSRTFSPASAEASAGPTLASAPARAPAPSPVENQ
ncbi:hypothetical protein BD309DRAFT_1023951 [Dichomitus squalens]|nr:hypothetical protein BD309DRAFT_1023951 [Dichomitus squalens]